MSLFCTTSDTFCLWNGSLRYQEWPEWAVVSVVVFKVKVTVKVTSIYIAPCLSWFTPKALSRDQTVLPANITIPASAAVFTRRRHHWFLLHTINSFKRKIKTYLSPLRLLWTPAQRKRASMLYFADVYLVIYFLWPPYSPALVNGGSRKFYTWWTLSVIREVTTWIFSWSSLNYRVGQKVTKFGIFSDPTRKLSAVPPELRRIR